MTGREINSVMRPLKLAYLRGKYPTVPLDELQSLANSSKWTDTTANALTKAIADFITFSGGYSNRINTQGQAIVTETAKYNLFTDKVDTSKKITGYRRSTTKRGTPDLSAVYNGRAIFIEIKAGKDKLSPEQIATGRQLQQSGALHFVAKDFAGFYAFWQKEILNN